MCSSLIRVYPEIILRSIAIDIIDFNDPLVAQTIKKLEDVMDEYDHCVGLAANQIGSNLNIFVADASKNKLADSSYGRVVLINPTILSTSKREVSSMREGCMSIPDLTGNVMRSTEIVVEAFAQNGNVCHFKCSDYEARVFQHEIDHLKGKVFLDRVKSSRDVFARKQYR